jgi:short-subunit dehydrogenase
MNVTRAVLPVMRKHRSGKIISISSIEGIVGFEFCAAYGTSKFALDGWMQSLQHDVAPFGIHTIIVNPGFFRTEILTQDSTTYADPSLKDYNDRREGQVQWWSAQNGQQIGDPAKLAQALIKLANQEQPPRRFIAGADAIAMADQMIAEFQNHRIVNCQLRSRMKKHMRRVIAFDLIITPDQKKNPQPLLGIFVVTWPEKDPAGIPGLIHLYENQPT